MRRAYAARRPPALKDFRACPPLVTDIDLSVDDRFLYVSCWGTGDLRQYDVSDPFQPKLTGAVRIGGIVDRPPHPGRPGPLNGGPQMVEISRDGRRIHVIAWPDGYRPHQVRLQGGDASSDS